MSSEDTASVPSARHANSELVAIEVYLLACGHGDTILLRLPEDRWVLIDCHLRNRGIRQRFFEFVRSKRINRLEFIFQTHPDFDHFCGMVEILNLFTTDGRSLGYWCDGGLDAHQVRDLIWGEELSEREYSRLHDRLDELSDDGLVQTVNVNDWTRPISPGGYADTVDLFVVAPPARFLRRIGRADITKLPKNVEAKLDSNALSVVLVLSIVAGGTDCNVLLAADATVDEMSWALKNWKGRAQEHDREEPFDAVKVPHHGSIKSHCPELCTMKRTDRNRRVAAVSAGTRRALPDREVIRAYLDEEWIVLLTTTRTAIRRANRLMDIADRSGVRDYDVNEQDVRIAWNPKDGLTWEPVSAQVDIDNLTSYETKMDAG